MRTTLKRARGGGVYFQAHDSRLALTNPVYTCSLAKGDALRLARHLAAFAKARHRGTITLSAPSVRAAAATTRLTLTTSPPPAYEARAMPQYVRGTALSVQAGPTSCNLVFTGAGAGAAADVLIASARKAKAFVRLVVERGNGKRDDLLQVAADTDGRAAFAHADSAALAESSLASAARTWGTEDFSDWEGR